MSGWWTELHAWRRQRFPLALYLPLAGLLLAGAHAAGAPGDVGWYARSLPLALGLLLHFRLWDDMADREEDARRAPERVLPRAHSLRPFRVLLTAVGVACLGLSGLSGRPGVLAAGLALEGFFLAWYGGARKRWGRLAGAHVALARYPVFVTLLAAREGSPRPGPLCLAAGLVYLTFCVHELLHDERLHPLAQARPLLGAELLGLGALSLGLHRLLDAPALALAHTVLAMAGAALLAGLFLLHRQRPVPRALAHGALALCLSQLVLVAWTHTASPCWNVTLRPAAPAASASPPLPCAPTPCPARAPSR